MVTSMTSADSFEYNNDLANSSVLEDTSLGELIFEEDEQEFTEVTEQDIDAGIRRMMIAGDNEWDEFTLQMIRESCAFMAQEILTGPAEPPYNGRFLISEHHEEWDDLISKHERLCILASRDHGKTYFVDFAYPIWKAVTMPGGCGFIFSNTKEQAIRILGDIKQEIMSNPRLRHLYPSHRIGTTWSSTSIKLTNGHRIYARGFGTKVRGAHPCLAYGTEIVTERGVECIGDLVGETRKILTGLGTWKEARFWKTGTREVVTAQFGSKYTRDKQKLTATPDHKVLTTLGWKAVGDLGEGEIMTLPEAKHDLLFEFMGWLWNDGNYSTANKTQRVYFSEKDDEALDRYSHFLTNNPHAGGCVYRVAQGKIQSAIDVVGKGHRYIATEKQPPTLQTAEQKTAWIRGMFSANGTVVRSVRLKLASLPVVEYIEKILHEFGVKTTPIVHYTDPLGFHNYLIHVHKKSIAQYLAVFGFVQSYKTAKAKDLAFPFSQLETVSYGRYPRRVRAELQDVFDFQVLDASCEQEMSAVSNGIIVHNCWIVVDDGLNDETAYSELVRKKQIDYFYTAITNMVTPGGQIIVVGTPFSSVDLYADLEQNSEYVFKRFPALSDPPEEKPLWPERYSKERLLKRREEIGAVRFTREFLCLPISDQMSLFPEFLFKGAPVEQPTLTLGMPKKFWDSMGVQIFMGVDFALSSSVEADYTVIWTMGKCKFGNRWIIDIERGKGLPYQDQLSMINATGRKYQPGLIFVEANQAQRIFGDELIRTTDLPIKQFVTTAHNKHALDKGVPSLRVLLENKKFRIPRGDARSVEMTDIWINEMRQITFNEGKVVSVGSHDDTCMGAWICDQAIRQGGFSFDFGDDLGDDQPLDDLLEELNAAPEIPGLEEIPTSGDESGQRSAILVDDDLLNAGVITPRNLDDWF